MFDNATPEQLRAALKLAIDRLTEIAYDKTHACSDAEVTIGEIEDLLKLPLTQAEKNALSLLK